MRAGNLVQQLRVVRSKLPLDFEFLARLFGLALAKEQERLPQRRCFFRKWRRRKDRVVLLGQRRRYYQRQGKSPHCFAPFEAASKWGCASAVRLLRTYAFANSRCACADEGSRATARSRYGIAAAMLPCSIRARPR